MKFKKKQMLSKTFKKPSLMLFLLMFLPLTSFASSFGGNDALSSILSQAGNLLTSHYVLAIAGIAIAAFGYIVMFRGYSSLSRLGQVCVGVGIVESVGFLLNYLFGS